MTTATAFEELLARHPLPAWRRIVWLMMALIVSFFVWAKFTTVEEVAVASGEVVPRGKVKVIQHLEGGIVDAIFVAEGDSVRAGELLVRLNLATSGVNRNELLARLDREEMRRVRLMAELGATPLAPLLLPADPAKRQPDIAAAELKTFEARRREKTSSQAVLREQINQRGLAVQELEAKKRSTSANLALARERLKLSESLLAAGLTARMEHLKMQAEVESLEGELAALGPAIPRAHAAVEEAEQRLKEADDRFRREANDQLGECEEQIARLRELLAEATDQGRRAEIRSPIDGVVKKLRYNTIGGVVAPGDPIMEIVPTEEKLVVSARLNTADRGYVHAGQAATVKITTYDFVRYGGLSGRVTHVAPDTSADAKTGAPYFEVTVETDKGRLGTDAQPLPITAGMQAIVDINTGERTVLDYLVQPVLKLRHEAFRER
ncbi:MAG: HlyD family type I secretion periplasmic adaptor subunit [Rhodospirillales bacterium]